LPPQVADLTLAGTTVRGTLVRATETCRASFGPTQAAAVFSVRRPLATGPLVDRHWSSCMPQSGKHAASPHRGAVRTRGGRHRLPHRHPFQGAARSALRTTPRVVGAALLLAASTGAAIQASAATGP